MAEIATESAEILEHAGRLIRLREALEACAAPLRAAERLGPPSFDIAEAVGALGAARDVLDGLPERLQEANERYEWVDRVAEFAQESAHDQIAWWMGFAGPIVGDGLARAVGAAFLGLWIVSGGRPAEWLERNPEVYTEWAPTVTEFIAQHGDAVALGAAWLPVGLAPLFGTKEMARLLTSFQPFGAFAETPVRIQQRLENPPPTAPRTLFDGVSRIKPDDPGAQVTIERYTMPDGSEVANVYIDGTIDWSPMSADEPFDMTSNVGGVAQNRSVGAAEAVELAMRDAGIGAETPVQLIGFSQGGIQAALIASRNEFDVRGLVTVGSPIGGMPLPDGLQSLSVMHEEDLVGQLDARFNPQVTSFVDDRFGDGRPMPPIAAPGHQFAPYGSTLRAVDASYRPDVRPLVEGFVDFSAGAVSSSSTTYTLERYRPEECAPAR